MYHNTPLNENIFTFLKQIDHDHLEQIQKKGCNCGGKLHQAHYPRSPMGITKKYRSYFEKRFSLCCGQCRKRTAVPTVRFFGRRWYPSLFFVFISLFQKKVTTNKLLLLYKRFGIKISKSTWNRWRRWWKECFVNTSFWKYEKGKFNAQDLLDIYPKIIFRVFTGSFEQRIILLLQFFSPITAGFLRAV